MSTPQQRWQGFVRGLVIFSLGALLLVFTAEYAVWLYWLSLAILFTGFAIAMRYYAGIFMQRISSFGDAKRLLKRLDERDK
ncbi:hypothetical protein [Alteromonas antoniana]|uniref:hypothetical protein n=1 Tax=Alteromonas antoniana TaxID=2803813 RepID=UPI001C46AEA1|nr:hypothetical protein [Alteromonas antoniana]